MTVRTQVSSQPKEFPEHTQLKQIQVGGGRFKREGVWKPASTATKKLARFEKLVF